MSDEDQHAPQVAPSTDATQSVSAPESAAAIPEPALPRPDYLLVDEVVRNATIAQTESLIVRRDQKE